MNHKFKTSLQMNKLHLQEVRVSTVICLFPQKQNKTQKTQTHPKRDLFYGHIAQTIYRFSFTKTDTFTVLDSHEKYNDLYDI